MKLHIFIGGGGGSRTPVRKHSALASTCLAQFLSFAPRASIGQDFHGTNLYLVSHQRLTGRADQLAHCSTPFSVTRAKTERALASMRLVHTRNRLRLLYAHLFYEQVEPRHATKTSIIPVEAFSPPFVRCTIKNNNHDKESQFKPHQYSLRFLPSSISLLRSFSFKDCLLSYFLLPLASASSTLAFPFFAK